MYSLIDLCCLCLVNVDTVTSILLQDVDGIVVQNKLEYVLPDIVHFKSEVLNNICVDCLSALNYVYKFKQECLQNLKSLTNYIEKMSLKTEEYNYFEQPNRMHNEITSANLYIANVTQHNLAEKEDMIQIKKSHSFQSHELKCTVSNAECTVTLDTSQHLFRENQVVENNDEKIQIKQELEYRDHEIDIKYNPLLLNNEDSKEKSGENFPNEPTNISDCIVTSDSNQHLLLENQISENNDVVKQEPEYLDPEIDIKYDPLLVNGEDTKEKSRDNFSNEPANISDCNSTSTDGEQIDEMNNKNTSLGGCYNCDKCQKSFQAPSHLKRHSRIHTGERPFKCTTCQKKFSQLVTLNRHKKTHTGEKPYACDVCNKTFTTKSDLTRHEHIHSSDRPFMCTICHKTFKRSSNVTLHMQIHTGEKPYQCYICQCTFTTAGSLKMHKRIHTGEKPYQCQICEHKFTRTTHLKVHMRKHTGEKPYTCKYCSDAFGNSPQLKRHIRTQHVKDD